MKIFQIGFNRCGTKSLHNFFKQNNHRSLHWVDPKTRFKLDAVMYDNFHTGKKPLDGWEDYIFFCDSNFVNRHYEVLDTLYPGSKFIFNVRPVEAWIKSRWNHGKGRTRRGYMKMYNLSPKQVRNFWVCEWKLHEYKIRQYFKGKRSKKLLIFNIMKDDGKTLAQFLPELKFKNLNFPHAHKKFTSRK